jgi:hypothetical protein
MRTLVRVAATAAWSATPVVATALAAAVAWSSRSVHIRESKKMKYLLTAALLLVSTGATGVAAAAALVATALLAALVATLATTVAAAATAAAVTAFRHISTCCSQYWFKETYHAGRRNRLRHQRRRCAR